MTDRDRAHVAPVVSADLRERVARAIDPAAFIDNPMLSMQPRRSQVEALSLADATLSSILRDFVLMPREDEEEWDATPAERLMIYKLIEWGSSSDDAGSTVGGLSLALAAGGFAIRPREPTEAMIEAIVGVLTFDLKLRVDFARYAAPLIARAALATGAGHEA